MVLVWRACSPSAGVCFLSCFISFKQRENNIDSKIRVIAEGIAMSAGIRQNATQPLLSILSSLLIPSFPVLFLPPGERNND